MTVKKDKTVDVLGTEYTICIRTEDEDELLESCDGYCDRTSHKIVVAEGDNIKHTICFMKSPSKLFRN